jgi:hypothetical protein
MKVGDLVKYRREALDAGVGIVIKQRTHINGPVWWSILWSNGSTEIVSVRNLKVVNASR